MHLYRVLLILEELAEDLQELLLWHSRHELDHLIEDDGGDLAHLGNVILAHLNVQGQKLLLARRRKVLVDRRYQ